MPEWPLQGLALASAEPVRRHAEALHAEQLLRGRFGAHDACSPARPHRFPSEGIGVEPIVVASLDAE